MQQAIPAAKAVSDLKTGHRRQLHIPLNLVMQGPVLYVPNGPFSGFHHLTYKHYLAMMQDRFEPDAFFKPAAGEFSLTQD